MKWCVEEDRVTEELIGRGWFMWQVADYLNDKLHAGQPVRTFWGIKNRRHLLARDKEELAEERRRSEIRKILNQEMATRATREEIARLLDERDRREAASYRSLAHEFFGDPPIGYAALDKHA